MKNSKTGHIPRKRWSQNFLTDLNIARKIAGSLEVPSPSLILEIGPGRGMLTRFLLDRAELVIGIEIDPDLALNLAGKLDRQDRLHIIQNDVLDLDLREILKPYSKRNISVAGNLPYHITSPILFKILEHANLFNEAVLMTQKEVAHRIAASPGSRVYGILSVFCQFYSMVDYLFTVPAHLFFPKPKVDSGVIRLRFFPEDELPKTNTTILKEIVRKTFSQRRKMLRNTLSQLYPEAILDHVNLDLTRRPEELSVEEFVNLSDQLQKIQKCM
ncbi:MAG: ribosomal RNA small subunit methyltransferase A [Calditrichaeota bacterium]|nr:ribosomal RNA small subunit methyltransferase A [Calditrichota bacterium]RQW06471.1 MAG: ribosomal RNA small subunit methyltransferase A [Calditrichota bacterium]